MRFIITHARYGTAAVVDEPLHTKAGRNAVRSVLRRAERGRLAGRNES